MTAAVDDRGGRRLHDRTGGVTLRPYSEILLRAINDDAAGTLRQLLGKRFPRSEAFQRFRGHYHPFHTFGGRFEFSIGSDERSEHAHIYLAHLHHPVAENERHPDRTRRKLSYDEIVASVESAFKQDNL